MFLKKFKMHKHDDDHGHHHGSGDAHHKCNHSHDHHKADHHHNHNDDGGHGHHHHHHFEIRSDSDISKSFIIGGLLNLVFVIVEIIIGIMTGSVSLVADAIHNFSDVVSLFLSWLGFKLNQTKSSKSFTFGYKKASVIIAFFNAVTLLLSLGFILYEAIHRLVKPEPIPETQVAIVAAIGVVINFASALLFKHDKHDVNIKSAYMHLIIDAVISLAVVVSAVLMKFTGWLFLDPLMAILIVLVIAKSTWELLRESFVLTLGGVPPSINIENLKETILKHSDVLSIHDLHVWSLSSSENAMTMHLLTKSQDFPGNKLYAEIKELIADKFRIHHMTIQVEVNDANKVYQCELLEKC